MNKIACLLLLFLCGCVAPSMQQSDFESIPIGTDIAAIEAEYGQPFDSCILEGGMEQRRYIQRFDVNSQTVEQREFIFNVREGKVVDKQYHQDQTARPYCIYQ